MVRKTVVRWAGAAIAVPLAAAGARRLGKALESRRGRSSRVGVALRRSADTLQRLYGRSPRRG
jgi:hypothetical protein